ALAAWPDVADTAHAILEQWPTNRPGFHRIDLGNWGVTIDLAIGEVEWALEAWQGRADAWFLDGFSPALNPGMWSDDIMARVAARSAPACHLATFTVAGAVRRALSANGFTVEKKPGHGRKRERLEARLAGTRPEAPAPRIAIIGAGIAGASLARAFKALGHSPTVVEAEHVGAGASGFPASLVTPRLDAGDAFIGGLYAQCLERAGQLYGAIDGAILSHGVIQLEHMARDAARFDKIAEQLLWPDISMARLSATEASALLGEPVSKGGLEMKTAFALSPASVLPVWLADLPLITATVASLKHTESGWQVLAADGTQITEADHVVLAAGWGNADLAPHLNLAPVAGQADWSEGEGSDAHAAAWGGYSVPTRNGLLYGATHDRGVTEPVPSDAATTRNRDTLHATLPERLKQVEQGTAQRRVAVRATTPDRLPVCGMLQDGLHILGGMGSRGFSASPLLAENLAATLCGTPSPLPADWAARLSPERFTTRSV
ncbi:FAD-dependent 5-carboxymethylaminomethyl-2-thiouridine(34) oxidoreductase MnmC, partial [Brevundimonas sp.]